MSLAWLSERSSPTWVRNSWLVSRDRQRTDQGLRPDSLNPSIHIPALSSLLDITTISWPWGILTQFYPPRIVLWGRLIICFTFLIFSQLSLLSFSINNYIFLGVVDVIWFRKINQGLIFFYKKFGPLILPLKISLGDVLGLVSPAFQVLFPQQQKSFWN